MVGGEGDGDGQVVVRLEHEAFKCADFRFCLAMRQSPLSITEI